MSERKLIKAVIAGEAELDELFTSDDESEEEETYVAEPEYDEEYEEDEDEIEEDSMRTIYSSTLFQLSTLSLENYQQKKVTAFTQSEGFDIYRTVASNPEESDEDERSEFLLSC